MNVKFYLSSGKKECTIRACLIIDRKRQFKINIPIKIEEKYWDSKKQQAKKSMHGYEVFNQDLEYFKLDLLQKIRLNGLENHGSWDAFKQGVTQLIKTGTLKTEKSCTVLDGISLFIEARSKEYKPGTVRKYHILKTLIEQFETKYLLNITTDNLDYSLVEKFRHYVLYDRDNRNDTAYRMIAALKCVIRWMIQNEYPINPGALSVNQPVKNKYDIVTLSEAEIQLIKSASLSIEQQRVRDCFLFQIYTGQRFSDMQQLSPDQVSNHMWIFRSVKTEKIMHIPFVGWTAEAEIIAAKYGFQFPQYTSQYFNRALKLICRNAGVDALVRLTRYQGRKEIIIDKPKHELVSSHTARRTSVSLLLAKGVPPTVVMKLTGHSDIKTMMKYERTTTELLEQSLQKISI